MARTRKRFTPEQKVATLKRHLVEKIPVSDLCAELEVSPTIFYNWQKKFFENGTATFVCGRKGPIRSQEAGRIAQLEAILAMKNEVLVELVQEQMQLKSTVHQQGGIYPPQEQRRGTRTSPPPVACAVGVPL